jgi:hypothetical protein
MNLSRRARLARLEHREEEGQGLGHVVWLGLDGVPEDPAALQDADVPIICLPRKSATAEQWVTEVAARVYALQKE